MKRKSIILLLFCFILFFIFTFTNAKKKVNDKEIVSYLSELVAKSAENNNFSGVLLFAKNENILFHKAYGLASRRYRAPNDIYTKFNLCSAYKMFTSVAIAKLLEEGKLSLDDPTGKFLDASWVSSDVGEKVTVSHLLTHTSGLGHYWTDEFDKSGKNLYKTLEDYKAIVSDELSFEPGTEWKYSNSGFILLGAIIEKVTGKTYFEYTKEVIFDPLGMMNTGCFELDQPIENIATGYFEDSEDGGRLKNNTYLHPSKGGPGGGGYSTAKDLHQFMVALFSDKIISAETRELFLTPTPLFKRYAHGFQIKDGWVGHSGGFDGFEAFICYYPESGRTFIVLSNYYDSALPIMKKMKKLLLKE